MAREIRARDLRRKWMKTDPDHRKAFESSTHLLAKSVDRISIPDVDPWSLGRKRTLMLMAEEGPRSTTTLVGCYYYYEK